MQDHYTYRQEEPSAGLIYLRPEQIRTATNGAKEGQDREKATKKPRNSSEAFRGSCYPIIDTRLRISSSRAFNFSVT